ncbi:hypothetical protein K490DRAFT_48836 [Saccharata proteae CBS 121410]|uniref:White collar n=1 Tax=Saccharata proteae CBS 121410 TaxID=1314787 RepID=A0A9P4LSG3_9PEZI|nr:hypothetical protein K490DRAFT_48836 [Saccharata proteae CBS 121410]
MSPNMVGGQSLDDIVNQNSKAMRRRSVPLHYQNQNGQSMDNDPQRVSMMEFSGASPGGQLEGFPFDPSTGTGTDMETMMRNGSTYGRQHSGGVQTRRPSMGDLNINTHFAGHRSPYAVTSMAPSGSAYASPLAPHGGLDVNITSPYVTSGLSMSMEMGDPSMNSMAPDVASMNLFDQPQFASPIMGSPIPQDFNASMQGPSNDSRMGGSLGNMDMNITSDSKPGLTPARTDSRERSANSSNRQQDQSSSRTPILTTEGASGPRGPDPPSKIERNQQSGRDGQFPWQTPPGGFPSSMHDRPHMESQFRNAYSSTGFDMLGVLMRVATRPKPEINIGSVDLSCAFVVCDAEKDDNPIVYCSENFERLTGYSKHMILGRNCRFLQSPDGKVEAGIKRKYVDDDSVLYLKNMINTRKEAQISLINYRRGGQPFMNLLTMIPITWDDTEVVKFFVGFQVDLVEQPNSVTNKNPDGSYSINYQRSVGMPRYVFNTPENTQSMDLGQTIPRDDVSALLETLISGETETSKRMWDKALLENTDDVVHVLSLKGLFLYLSPSAAKLLEYEPSELVGTALSSVCHPSDIVPVTRELKDTSSGSSVNVVFRIRRKNSGYMWFEGHGSLHTEQGKGRKCIILVGRERPVYALNKSHIEESGGIGDNELWTKMSTSGMFLFVSSNVRSLLDRQPEDLQGTSIQQLMRPESRQEFYRILELARSGKKASVKHEMINKRGQVLQAFTTVYPGDAVEGQKPTFFVAQTRLIKSSRSIGNQAAQRPQLYQKQERDSGSSIPSSVGGSVTPAHTVHTNMSGQSSVHGHGGLSANQYNTSDGSALTYAGSNGLKLGHQDASLASDENVFDELKTTRSTSWQYELRQMEKRNRLLAEEVQSLMAAKKKRKRRNGAGQMQKDCANCHTRVTPEWRRGPSGNRDLCNSCGLRWAKQQSVQSGTSDKASKASASPRTKPVSLKNNGEPGSSSIPSTTEQVSGGPNSHAAKVARMEPAMSQGLGGSIPPKIDEGVEDAD